MIIKNDQNKKARLHPRNKNRTRYDLIALTEAVPELKGYVKPNKRGEDSVDFASPLAVKLLNKALLKHYYGIDYWEFPDENLCPPIPGRADYIHHMSDLLRESNFGVAPAGEKITCLDIGLGASCIYPILGVTEYNWNFIASEIDQQSLNASNKIISANPSLVGKIETRWQKDPNDAIYGVLAKEEKIDLTICNPPFYSSVEDAAREAKRKVRNLTGKKEEEVSLNFSGRATELVTIGGEAKFLQNMIRESEKFAKNSFWFSSLVSKQSNLKGIYKTLEKWSAKQVKTIPMGTGNKSTRIVAWSFLTKAEQLEWRQERWNAKE